MNKSILSPKTEIRKTSLNGIGTYAKEDIKKGEMIYIRGGELMKLEEAFNYIPGKCPDGMWPITDEYWLGARNEEDFKQQKVYVNHSCNPNCRKVITGFDWKIKELQDKYYDYFAQYLKDKIDIKRNNKSS